MRGSSRIILSTLVLLLFFVGCGQRKRELERYEWANSLSGNEVRMLAPGVISGGEFEMNAALSQDGGELYFSRSSGMSDGDGSTLFHSSWRDSHWTTPDKLPFSGSGVDADPFLTRDGKRLYFTSKRREGGGVKGDFDLWYADRTDSGWSEPVRLPEPVNSPDHDVSPWITGDGSLWFSSRREGGEGEYDIWYAPAVEGGFGQPVNAGPSVNTLGVEVDVCLSEDGRLMIYASHDQPVHFGSGDLYALIRGEDGFVGPYNLGQPVNSEAMECCPSISPDGKLLLFASTRSLGRTIAPAENPEGELDAPQIPNTPGNGLGDIYVTDLSELLVVQEFGWSPNGE